jgi:hypothetical protein
MKTSKKFKLIIAFYLVVLIFLLLSVFAMPLLIQHDLAATREIIIEEEILETSLIVILFATSCFIIRGFKYTLTAHQRLLNRTGEEKSRLISRLEDAFSYIGVVNVGLQEMKSIFCGIERYPQTKKEFKQLIDHLASKVMTVAKTPWVVVRMISRCNSRTIKEYAVARPRGTIPSATMGNQEIVEDRHVEGLRKIGSCQKNLDFLTVCILPSTQLSEEDYILITAITNQIEMLFLLYLAGTLNQHVNNFSIIGDSKK